MSDERHLDNLVAFYVMGYETLKDGNCDCANGRAIGPQCGYQIDVKLGAAPHTWVVPYFSESMEDAWAVVVHLEHHENRYEWLLQQVGETSIAGCKSTMRVTVPSAHKGKLMPEAICRAALKAMNVPYVEAAQEQKRVYSALEIPKS